MARKTFLQHWIVGAKLVSPDEMSSESVGENDFQIVGNCCVIKILKPEYYGERVVKYCAEKTLVHELLHLKYNWLVPQKESVESVYYDTLEHSLLEQMAKSLIMAKYNIPLSWFKS